MEEKANVQEKISSFKKGIELEQEFCEYLKTNLGWEKARIRSQMSSKYNMRGTNVDVIAQRLNQKKKKWLILASFIYCAFFIYLIYFGFKIIELYEFKAYLILILAVIIGYYSYLFFKMTKTNITEYGWVECKNLKEKATIKHLQIMIVERDAHLQSEKRFKIVETYFVSANGFKETAYNYALEKKIKCYLKQDNVFRETEYWNN